LPSLHLHLLPHGRSRTTTPTSNLASAEDRGVEAAFRTDSKPDGVVDSILPVAEAAMGSEGVA